MRRSNGVAAAVGLAIVSGSGSVSAQDTSVQLAGLEEIVVTAFIDNLFDDDTLEASWFQSDSATNPYFFQLASSEAVLANERQYGVTATYRF